MEAHNTSSTWNPRKVISVREEVGQTHHHGMKVRGSSKIKVSGRQLLNIPNSPPPGMQRSEVKGGGERYIMRDSHSYVTLENYFYVPCFPYLHMEMG